MKSEEGMGERKGRIATATLLSRSSELVRWGHLGRNLLCHQGESCFRGRKWRYNSNANVGSSSAPSALKTAVKTWYGKGCPSVISNPKPCKWHKGGEQRAGHHKELPKDFCFSNNPSARNMYKCRHSVFTNRRQPAVTRLFPSEPFPRGTVSRQREQNPLPSHREEIHMHYA